MLIFATRYADCEAALSFLTRVLCLTEHAVFRDEAGRITHAQLTMGRGMVMFGPADREGEFAALMASPGGGRVTGSIYMVPAADLDWHYRRAVAAKAEILIHLRDEDHGGRSFTLRDPEGQLWTLGDYDPFAPVPETLPEAGG